MSEKDRITKLYSFAGWLLAVPAIMLSVDFVLILTGLLSFSNSYGNFSVLGLQIAYTPTRGMIVGSISYAIWISLLSGAILSVSLATWEKFFAKN